MTEDLVKRLCEASAFLDGRAPLDGVHFGDKHPKKRGNFWWRTEVGDTLNDAIDRLTTPQAGDAVLSAAPNAGHEAACEICAGKCHGHSLGRPEEWVPEPGSRQALRDANAGLIEALERLCTSTSDTYDDDLAFARAALDTVRGG